jgi:hypothetical protein
MKSLIKTGLLTIVFLLLTLTSLSAGSWSFSGGYMFFDNSNTQWEDNSIMLIIGKSNWSGVYEMTPADEPDLWYCALPSSGWSDAEYMAVIGGGTVWSKGEWGPSNLTNATHYTAAYTAGLNASAGQGFLFTPQSTENGCTIKLTYRGEGFSGKTFATADKNNCYAIDTEQQQITFIFSTSDKRFNINRSDIRKVYVYGSISAWEDADEDFRLNGNSDDGCLYRTFPLSILERVGNSGQPEFLFHVLKTDGSDYTAKSSASWTGGIDYRLLFANSGGENMVVALPSDDLDEIHARSVQAQNVRPLAKWNLDDEDEQKRIANFRQVPATQHLYRSYHPFDPSRPQHDTEPQRLFWVAQNAQKTGILSDIALSGDMTSNAGKTYTCAGKQYTITIPDYYQSIIANNNVLYVGSANGHVPSYKDAIFFSDGERFGQWIQEIVAFIIDDNHPAPFQIHCALGSDRTGAFCAVLAALCGADYQQIAADYEATSNMQVNEYRHRNCIRFCLKRITGSDPETDPDFNKAVADHFISHGYLTSKQIQQLKAKLTNGTTTDLQTREHQTSDIDHRKFLINGQMYILRGEKVWTVTGQDVK